ncbi:hypothetical protein [Leifsonia poae]|uniref:hypothetical protein n=1 Tax=Leifsonia poae TaxID=110933 RepID=UPI001CBD5372|nr:hypothetical protein [Leifsonia poae]
MLPAVSTSSLAFQSILDDLVRTVGEVEAEAPLGTAPAGGVGAPESDIGAGLGAEQRTAARIPPRTGPQPTSAPLRVPPPPPALLRARGDLTLVVGLGPDALAAARELAADIGDAEVRPGGSSRAAAPRADDRRGALRARADGVRRERAIVVAYGLSGAAAAVADIAESLAGIEPDQVWAAVDSSRKTEDTAGWVRAVDAVLAVDGLVVSGAALTATPETVRGLGIPVRWIDGAPGGIG